MKALNRNSFIDSIYLFKTIITNGISSIIYKIFQLENFQRLSSFTSPIVENSQLLSYDVEVCEFHYTNCLIPITPDEKFWRRLS